MAIVTVPVVDPDAAAAEASSRHPLAVIVVGPVAGMTSYYLRDARRIAAQLRSYGARVRQVYSPRATWARVKEASRGANLFVYLGHGNGYPSPYGRFNPRTMNGLGLNARAGAGNSNERYYGEYYLRRALRLAPGAVVVLNHVCYAAGGSEPGRAHPMRWTAVKRADNFAAGFIAAGAAVVFASDRSVTSSSATSSAQPPHDAGRLLALPVDLHRGTTPASGRLRTPGRSRDPRAVRPGPLLPVGRGTPDVDHHRVAPHLESAGAGHRGPAGTQPDPERRPVRLVRSGRRCISHAGRRPDSDTDAGGNAGDRRRRPEPTPAPSVEPSPAPTPEPTPTPEPSPAVDPSPAPSGTGRSRRPLPDPGRSGPCAGRAGG